MNNSSTESDPNRLTEFLCPGEASYPYKNVLIEWTVLYRIRSPVSWQSFYDQVQGFIPTQNGTWMMNNSFTESDPHCIYGVFKAGYNTSNPYKKVLKWSTILLPNLIHSRLM